MTRAVSYTHLIGLFFFPLFPQGAEILPLEAGALAAPADVYHHAHLGQQQEKEKPNNTIRLDPNMGY